MYRLFLLIISGLVFISCAVRNSGFYRNTGGEYPVIYHILIDRFYDGDRTNNYLTDKNNPYGFHGGDLRGLLERVDYIKELGVNVVLVSPVIDNISSFVDYKGFRHYGYHGYWPEDFDRIEENFGDMNIYRSVVSEFHRNKIAYLQDIVLNHIGYKSFWVENTLWVRSIKYGGCVDNDDLRMCLFGLPDFKTEREDVRRFLVSRYTNLMRIGGFDGVRIDAMKHIDETLVRELRENLKNLNNDIILLGEYWGIGASAESLEIKSRYNVDMLFDFEFRDYLSAYLRQAMRGEVFVKYLNRRYEYAEKGFVVFLNNHDLDGLITHFKGIDEERKNRLYRIMALMQFLCGGIPVIYYGEENGLDVGEGIENRRDMDFSERVKGLRSFYKKLIHLKKGGVLNGIFESEMRDGVLLIHIKRGGSEVVSIVNIKDSLAEVELGGSRIRIDSYDFALIESTGGRLNYIIPH